MWRSVFAFVLAALLAGPAALAQGAEEGVLNAVAYRQIPVGTAIEVQAMDNSDDNMVLLREFVHALQSAGYTVAQNAPIILSFETRDDAGAWTSSGGDRTLVEFQGSGGSSADEEAKVMVNLFDSGRGGVLNKGKGGTSIVTPAKFRIDATLDDRANGKRLWTAWTVGDLGHRDGLAVSKAMVPALVGGLGRTVKRQTFKLP